VVDARAGFQNGFVFEIFDTAPGAGVVETFVCVLNPAMYTLTEPFQNVLTPAEDDSIVAEEVGIIQRQISLGGTFGLSKKRVAAGFEGRPGNGAELSGSEHFIKLRQFFRSYSDLKKDPARAETIRMHFHSMRDEDHFIVVPVSFETPRDAKGSRMHYEYRVSLTAIARLDASSLRQRADPADFNSAIRDISRAFHDARGYIADVTSTITEVRARVQGISTMIRNVASLLTGIGNVLQGVTSAISSSIGTAITTLIDVERTGERLAESLTGLVADEANGNLFGAERQIRRLESALNRTAMYPERFGTSLGTEYVQSFEGERRLTALDVRRGTAGAARGSSTRVTYGSGVEDGLDIGRYAATRTETVTRTDTVDGFAGRYDVPPEAIILLNDLRPPYIAEGGGPGLLAPGDEILIPTIGAGAALPVNTNDAVYRTADDLLYGVDLALDQTVLDREGLFEIRIDSAHGAEDAEMVRGVANVVQGTRISIETERGSTTFLPEVGILRNVGVKGTLQHVLLAALRVREAILLDPRIESIQSSRVVLDGDVLTQEITPLLRGRTQGPPIVIPFARASGGGA
jgi:hypothetical protein